MPLRHAGKAEQNLHVVQRDLFKQLHTEVERVHCLGVWATNLCILLASKTVMCQQVEHCRVSRVTIICLAQQLQALTIALQHRAVHQLYLTRTVTQNQLHQHALASDSKKYWIGQWVQHPYILASGHLQV